MNWLKPLRRCAAPALVAAALPALAGLALGAAAQQSPRQPPAAAAPEAQALEGVAALVNDEVITFTDVRNRAQLILLSLGAQPDEDTIIQAQIRALESLIEDKLKMQEFRERRSENDADPTVDEARVNRTIESIAQQNGQTAEVFFAELSARGINPETLREQTRADIAWRDIVGGLYGSRIRISPVQIDDMMERLEGNLNRRQNRVAEIFLPAPDAASRANALEGAESLRRQIERGAPFDLVAEQFSAAPSAAAGGDLGWVTEGDLRPELDAAVAALTAPAISAPIETDDGVYLVAVFARRDPSDANAARLNLSQLVASGEDAAKQLEAARASVQGCETLGQAAASVEGVRAVALGEAVLSGLAENYRAALADLPVGGSTPVLDFAEGSKTIVFVCGRSTGGDVLPDRETVEDQLFEQQISMLADRHLRDLKREATIVRR